MKFLQELAERRRFGMKPGLTAISAMCAALGDPQNRFKAIHIAGTNGKGAVAAMLDACLPGVVGRYTSPHLVRLNERFFLNGVPADDATLERLAARVAAVAPPGLTFFEALTAVAFLLYAESACDHVVMETGLGGRLDATNVCCPELCVITRIGLDHCDWLGDTVEKIASEKAGIIKPGVPVVLGRNEPSVRAVIETRARELGSPFHYAPELASAGEIPASFSLPGAFNRENAVTALAALKVLADGEAAFRSWSDGFSRVVWPGRFQRVGSILIDGAHNPPAAAALVSSLAELGVKPRSLDLVFGACGDKDVAVVLRALAPLVARAFAVRTNNPRSLAVDRLALMMGEEGMTVSACASLAEALASVRRTSSASMPSALVCGSLFLAGEALVALNAYPWMTSRFDPAELLRP